MAIDRKLKDFVYSLSNKIVLISYKWLVKTIYIPENDWRRVFHRWVIFLGDLGGLIQDIFHLPAYMAVGNNWKFVFVGDESERLQVEHLFFGEKEIEWQPMERVIVWNKEKDIQKWASEGVNLVIYNVSRLLPLAKGGEYRFAVPSQVRQVLTFPENLEVLLAGKSMIKVRGILHKAERNGYSYHFSKSKADFDEFYLRTYVPFIKRKHGPRAQVESYDSMLKRFQHGGLIMLTRGEQIVAISLVYKLNDTAYGTEYGIKDEYLEGEGEVKIDIPLLIYWYTILWAHNQRARKVDLGGSLGVCSNGIFRNKRRWETKVHRFEYIYYLWQIYLCNTEPKTLEALNMIGFITEDKGSYYRVVLQEGNSTYSENQLMMFLETAQRDGLKGVVLTGSVSKKVIEAVSQ